MSGAQIMTVGGLILFPMENTSPGKDQGNSLLRYQHQVGTDMY